MVENDQKWQNITKQTKNGHNSTNITIKWPKIIKYCQKWPNLNKKNKNGHKRIENGQNWQTITKKSSNIVKKAQI